VRGEGSSTLYSLLSTLYSLLSTLYSLLFTLYSLLASDLLKALHGLFEALRRVVIFGAHRPFLGHVQLPDLRVR